MSKASISREAKNTSKKIRESFLREKGGPKNQNFITVPGTRGQSPGTSRVSYRPDSTKIDPHPAQIRPRWPKMLRSRFWLQKKDLGASVGAIGMVFRDLSGRSRPDSKNPKIELRFLSCPFIKGTLMENSYIPYKRPAPILQTPILIPPTDGCPPHVQEASSVMLATMLGNTACARWMLRL